MSISSIPPLSGLYSSNELSQTNNSQSTSGFGSLFSDFRQLSQALQSGNLTQAQQAYNALTQNAPSGQANGPLASAINALGQALQSGNLQPPNRHSRNCNRLYMGLVAIPTIIMAAVAAARPKLLLRPAPPTIRPVSSIPPTTS
jgi:hypothetical protein